MVTDDKTYKRMIMIETAIAKAGKSFGKEYNNAFYDLMIQSEINGESLWYVGEKEYYEKLIERDKQT